MNPCIRGYTCFLGRPLNSSSNCSSSWAPRGSSLFTQKAVEEVSQHSLIGSPCCRTIRAEPSFSCDDNNTSRILVGLPISCISLTKLEKIVLNPFQNLIIIPILKNHNKDWLTGMRKYFFRLHSLFKSMNASRPIVLCGLF